MKTNKLNSVISSKYEIFESIEEKTITYAVQEIKLDFM